MSVERWTKRMDDAVESAWLRSLRSQARVARTARHVFVPTPSAKQTGPGLGKPTIARAER